MEEELNGNIPQTSLKEAAKASTQALSGVPYQQSRRDVGLDFEDFNKYDQNTVLGSDQNKNRAANQGGLKTIGNSVVQLGTGTIAEAAKTVGYIGTLFGGDEQYGELNGFAKFFVEDIGESVEKFGKELAPVYTDTEEVFDPLDHEWLAKTITNFGPTLGMLVGSMGVGFLAKGVGQVGKSVLRKSIKDTIRKASIKSGKAGAFVSGFAETAAYATISRNAESMAQANQLYKETYETQKKIHPEYSEEQLKEIATTAADDLYDKAKMLGVIDLLRFNDIMKAFKIPGILPKKVSDNMLYRGLKFLAQPLGEALEEGAQYTFEQQVKDGLYGYGGEQDIVSTFIKGLKDKEMQESLVQGALGGGIFAGAGKAFQKLTKYSSAEEGNANQAIAPEATETPQSTPAASEVDDFDEAASATADFPDAPDSEIVDYPDAPMPQGDEGLSEAIKQSLSIPDLDPATLPNTDYPDLPAIDYPDIEKPNEIEVPDMPPIDFPDAPVNAEQEAAADYLSDPTIREDVLDLFQDDPERQAVVKKMGNDKKENYDILLGEETGKLQDAWVDTVVNLKKTYGKDTDLVGSQIQLDAIKNSKLLSKNQKEELSKPHRKRLTKTEDLSTYNKTNITGYKEAYKVAKELIKNKAQHLNSDKVTNEDVKPALETADLAQIKEWSNIPDISEEGTQRLVQELDRRLAGETNKSKVTQLEKLKGQILQEPLSEEVKDQLEIQEDTSLNKLLEKVIDSIGTKIKINLKAKKLKYSYDSNTLYLPKNTSKIHMIQEIASRVSEEEYKNPIIKRMDTYLKDNGFDGYFESLDRIFIDEEYATALANTPVEETPNKSVLRKFLEAIGELLGVTQPNLLEELIYSFEQELISNKEAIDASELSAKANRDKRIELGKITNIVSPYMMYEYEPESGKVYNTSTGVKEVYKVTSTNTGDYIMVKGKKAYLQPGYKSLFTENVNVLLDEFDQPLTNGFYDKNTQEAMKEDIPYLSELKLVVDTSYKPKSGKPLSAENVRINLYKEGTMVGTLPGYFKKHGKDNEALLTLRNQIWNNHKENKPQGTITFVGAEDTIIRTNKKYSYQEVLPQGQTPKIGIYAKTNEQMTATYNRNAKKEGKPQIAIGTKIVQFSETDFKIANTNISNRLGEPILYVKDSRGNEVPIKGDRLRFGDSSEYRRRFYNTFISSPPGKREEALRDLVRYTASDGKGNMVTYPRFTSDNSGVRRFGNTIIKAENLKEGDLFIFPDEGYKNFLKGQNKNFVDVPMGIILKDGNYQLLDSNMNSIGDPEPLDVSQVYHHPAQRYYQHHNIDNKPVQIDRDRLNDQKYLESISDRMSFQVSPKTIFTIPERKIKMEMNNAEPKRVLKKTKPVVNVVEQVAKKEIDQQTVSKPINRKGAKTEKDTTPVSSNVETSTNDVNDFFSGPSTPKESRAARRAGKQNKKQDC